MKIRTTISIIISLITTILVPIFTTTLVGGNDALGVLFILFITLYPISAIAIGILSGINKFQWYIPLFNAVIFLVGHSIFLTFDPTLLTAAFVYAVIGVAAAFVTKLIKDKKEKK